MKTLPRIIGLCFGFGFFLGGTGCFNLHPQDDPTRIFLLQEMTPPHPVISGSGLSIGVNHVLLPEYLNTPKMVLRDDENEISLSEFNRWGEDLDTAISRNLADFLKKQIPHAAISRFPWSDRIRRDYTINIEISRFEGSLSGTVNIEAGWSILSEEGNLLNRGETHFSDTWDREHYRSLVSSLSKGLAFMGGEIAVALQALTENN